MIFYSLFILFFIFYFYSCSHNQWENWNHLNEWRILIRTYHWYLQSLKMEISVFQHLNICEEKRVKKGKEMVQCIAK